MVAPSNAVAKFSLGRERIPILMLEGIHPRAAETFRADGYTAIESHATALPGDELIQRLRTARLLGIRSRTALTREVLQAAPRLIAVGCFCIGTNQIDLRAAEELGIPVFHAPFSNTRSVAELVLAEIVMLCRRVPERNALAHRGVWAKSAAGSTEVRPATQGDLGAADPIDLS